MWKLSQLIFLSIAFFLNWRFPLPVFGISAAATPNYVAKTVTGFGGGKPTSVAVNPHTGKVYIAGNVMSFVILAMDADGTLSTFAGSGVAGYTDGLGTNARIGNSVSQLSFCSYNNVDTIYFTDYNFNLVRAVSMDGEVTTIAGGKGGVAAGSTDAVGTNAGFNGPRGVACDSSNGDVWVVDKNNVVIRKIAYGTKEVTTMAGQLGTYGSVINGVGTDARFSSSLYHITYNPNNGCFYVADVDNHVIRQITVLREVSTFAGTAGVASPFLDGIGTLATFKLPSGIGFDPTNGNIIVGAHSNHRIRVINSATAEVTTIAGNGQSAPLDGMGTYSQVGNSFFLLPLSTSSKM